jgi:hypothetical protein
VVRPGGTAGAAVSGLSENNGTVAAADQTRFTAEIDIESRIRVEEVKGYDLGYWLDLCLQVRREVLDHSRDSVRLVYAMILCC